MYVIKHTIFFSKKVKLMCMTQNDFPTPNHVNIFFYQVS